MKHVIQALLKIQIHLKGLATVVQYYISYIFVIIN